MPKTSTTAATTQRKRKTASDKPSIKPSEQSEQSEQQRASPFGFHAPIAGGLEKALLKASAAGCTAVQIFSRNPRGWTARPLATEEVERFHQVRAETKLSLVVIHVCYLVNLAAGDAAVRERSRIAFREEIERGLTLGADYLVVHPGSSVGTSEAEGIIMCAESLGATCADLDLGRLRILLENTAGQGACIGHRFEHLREIIERCPKLDLGVCFDTAHAFAAGYDLRDEDGLAATLDALEHQIGLHKVAVVHFNDSKADYNSRVDRHWHIGEGCIGAEALRRIACHRQLRHAAFLLETPQDNAEDDERNINRLRSFVGDES